MECLNGCKWDGDVLYVIEWREMATWILGRPYEQGYE